MRRSVVIFVVPGCRREIGELPDAVRGDLADALARLDIGLMLSLPLSRPMPGIGRGVHELRLKDRSAQYRVVYALVIRDAIYILHAFKKTTQTTPRRNIALVQARMKEIPR